MLVIDHLAKSAQISIIMIIEIEYLIIIKFIIKRTVLKKTHTKDLKEKLILISIYFVI